MGSAPAKSAVGHTDKSSARMHRRASQRCRCRCRSGQRTGCPRHGLNSSARSPTSRVSDRIVPLAFERASGRSDTRPSCVCCGAVDRLRWLSFEWRPTQIGAEEQSEREADDDSGTGKHGRQKQEGSEGGTERRRRASSFEKTSKTQPPLDSTPSTTNTNTNIASIVDNNRDQSRPLSNTERCMRNHQERRSPA